jgi:hypothetical protein
MSHFVYASTTRISDLPGRPVELEAVPREGWASGDYVAVEILDGPGLPYFVEAPVGRMAEAIAGDMLVGALGRRAATLETAGDWRAVGEDLLLSPLTPAGILGKVTSRARLMAPLPDLRYRGHVLRGGRRCTMADFAHAPEYGHPQAPVILIIGTSMDAGKTTAACAIVRALKDMGLRVAGTKLTGVARYRDVLAMSDSGADFIADFVDGGLPSTVVDAADYQRALAIVMAKLAAARPDVIVAEAGASPLEPYNGSSAIRELGDHVCCTVLCASDPYAVVGVMTAFGTRPELVSGRATTTEAGNALVERLTGIPALNLLERSSAEPLSRLLADRLDSAGIRALPEQQFAAPHRAPPYRHPRGAA